MRVQHHGYSRSSKQQHACNLRWSRAKTRQDLLKISTKTRVHQTCAILTCHNRFLVRIFVQFRSNSGVFSALIARLSQLRRSIHPFPWDFFEKNRASLLTAARFHSAISADPLHRPKSWPSHTKSHVSIATHRTCQCPLRMIIIPIQTTNLHLC